MEQSAAVPAPERPQTVERTGFRAPGRRARATVVAFYLLIAVAAFTVVADAYGLAAVNAGLDDAENADSMLTTSDRLDTISGFGFLVAGLTLIVIFLLWFRRVTKNVAALGIGNQRVGPTWAVVSWFVPIVNWFVPKMAANDVWRAGDPDLGRGATPWYQLPVAAIVHWWWAAFLVTSIFDNVAARLWWNSATELEDYKTVYVVDLAAAAGNIVAALLAIAVVKRMTRRQEARAASLGLS